MCGSKKVSMSSFFFWNSYFWSLTFSGTMFGPKKVWVPFFWNSYFFWNPYFYWHYVWHQKVWIPFFWELFFLELIHFFLEPWNPYFFDVMFGPKKYEPCPFPELLGFFFAVIFWWTKYLDFSEMPFFPVRLTLNTFVVELSLFLRIKAFIL